MEEDCIHGLGVRAWCVICTGHEPELGSDKGLPQNVVSTFVGSWGRFGESHRNLQRVAGTLGGMIDEAAGPKRSEQAPRAARRIERMVG